MEVSKSQAGHRNETRVKLGRLKLHETPDLLHFQRRGPSFTEGSPNETPVKLDETRILPKLGLDFPKRLDIFELRPRPSPDPRLDMLHELGLSEFPRVSKVLVSFRP